MSLNKNLTDGKGNGKYSMNFEQKEHFLNLIDSGKYRLARDFADVLSRNGMSRSSVNRAGYDIVERLKLIDQEKAKELCDIFSEYSWPCWLLNI